MVTGSLGTDPSRGFVLYTEADRWIDPRPNRESSRFVNAEPRFFSSAGRSGALRIVSASPRSWVLESSGGVRSVLELDTLDQGPSYYVLGKRLDPAHLPPIAQRGLVVPVVYGSPRRKAVLLVGRKTLDGPWTEYGYLEGFSLPPASTIASTLLRPLRGPKGALFRIDPRGRRLVPGGIAGKPPPPASSDIPPRCSTWHVAGAASYVTCPDRISVLRPDGSQSVVGRYAAPSHVDSRWTYLAVSPSARTILLEHDIYACGTSRQAFVLSVRDGVIRPAFGDPNVESEPLGWLPGEQALVAAQRPTGCEGYPESGLYTVWTDVPDLGPQLVLATSSQDATAW